MKKESDGIRIEKIIGTTQFGKVTKGRNKPWKKMKVTPCCRKTEGKLYGVDERCSHTAIGGPGKNRKAVSVVSVNIPRLGSGAQENQKVEMQ